MYLKNDSKQLYSRPMAIPSVQCFFKPGKSFVITFLHVYQPKLFTLNHFLFSFRQEQGCIVCLSSCSHGPVSHVISLTLLLRRLFSNAQTIGCSCANIHADYYFISMIVSDNRHF